MKARTENISSSGVLFVADGVLAVDEPIEMTLVMPPAIVGAGGASVVCVGRVARTAAPPAPGAGPAVAATITGYRLVRSGGGDRVS